MDKEKTLSRIAAVESLLTEAALEVHKEDKMIEQWEFSDVYLSTESKGDRFVILFKNATKFEV